MKNILLLGTNNFFYKNLKSYIKIKKINYNVDYLKDEKIISSKHEKEINKIKLRKFNLIIIVGGLSGGILFNINNSFRILSYNSFLYDKIFSLIKSIRSDKIIYMSASCVYPKYIKKKIKENNFMNGEIEATSFGYSVSKIIGHAYSKILKKKNITVAIPATIFGKGEFKVNKNSHVINSIISKMLKRKNVTLWGSGKPRREFIYIYDLLNAIFFIYENNINDKILNIGSNKDFSIKELVKVLKKILNFKGKINWDRSKPDGVYRKLLDSSKLFSYGWRPQYTLDEALKQIKYDYF